MKRKKVNTEIIAFRMSKWEKQQLEKACEKTNQSKSRFIVMAVLEKVQKVVK